MITYNIKYSTKNSYENRVNGGMFEFLVMPHNSKQQMLLSYKIINTPNERVFFCKNCNGFEKIVLATKEQFQEMRFELQAKVQVSRVNNFEHVFIAPEEEYALITEENFHIDYYWYLTNSKTTQVPKAEIKSFPKYSKEGYIFDYLLNLKEYLYNEIEFCTKSTTVETSAKEALKIKKGVCQDFAHIFIGIARENGIACRYVSGYLNQGANFNGAAQMHAWCEAYIPKAGWIGFDPSNNLVVDENYIKVAHGIDYNECAPINGVVAFGGEMESSHEVIIKVEQ